MQNGGKLQRYTCHVCFMQGNIYNMLCCANTKCPVGYHLHCIPPQLQAELLMSEEPTVYLCDNCHDTVEELGWLDSCSSDEESLDSVDSVVEDA